MFFANTLVFVQLILYAVSIPVSDNAGEEKVYLGDEPEENYPSLVSLTEVIGKQVGAFCGASLITEKHLLTAAHCFDATVKQFVAVLGSRNSKTPVEDLSETIFFGPGDWKLHPNYTGSGNYQFDTAIITLPKKASLSKDIQPIRLAKKDYTKNVRVVGWGRKDCEAHVSSRYIYAKGWIVDHAECNATYTSNGRLDIGKNQLCARFKNNKGEISGSDRGDSGGPLYATADDGKDVQIGIVSSNVSKNKNTTKECVDTKFPNLFSDLKFALNQDFIQKEAPGVEFV